MSVDDEKYERLKRYVKNQMNSAERHKFEQEIKSDPGLTELSEMLKIEISITEDGKWYNLREAAHELLKRQLSELKGKSPQQAVTLFDSKLLPLPEGVRPATVETRRLRYRVGDGFLDISIYPISLHSFELIGQLSNCENITNLSVCFSGKQGKYTETTNQLGMFRFEKLPLDSYDVVIKSDKSKVSKFKLEL